jgi:hypothetical protein
MANPGSKPLAYGEGAPFAPDILVSLGRLGPVRCPRTLYRQAFLGARHGLRPVPDRQSG